MKFELKVGHGSKPADDGIAFLFFHIFHQKALERIHFHVAKIGNGLLNQRAAFREAEQRLFVFVSGYANDHSIEQTRGTLDYVKVPVGRRVETAGINHCSHLR